MADIREQTTESPVWGAGGFACNEIEKRRVMVDPATLAPVRVAVGKERHVVDTLTRASARCANWGGGRLYVDGHLGRLEFRAEDVSPETLAAFMARVES